jgi:prophage tail gpP-like protein
VNVSLCKIVLENGTELRNWDNYSINSDFLTPTDGWTIGLGGDSYWTDIVELLQPDTKVQIWVDGVRVLTGFVDIVRTRSDVEGGVRVEIQGRDVLRPLCKANIHPGSSSRGLTLEQMVARCAALL